MSNRLINASIVLCAVATGLMLTSRSLASPGDLYVTDLATGSIIIYAPDGTATTFDTGLTSPQGICFDQAKNLYVADANDGTSGTGTIFKYDISVGGSSKTAFRTGLNNPQGMALDGSDILVSEKGANQVIRVPLDGGTPTVFQLITAPLGLDSRGINDGAGLYRYIANGSSVLKKAPDGTTTNFDFSGDGSRSVSLDLTGNAFVSTGIGTITEIFVADDTMATFATGFTLPTGMDFRPAKFSGDMDRVGFLYVGDTTAGTISQISQTGTNTIFVSSAGMPNYMIFEVAGAPVVVTGIASGITDTTATLNGTVNPNGNPTTYHFEYGLTTAYGSNTTSTSAGSGLDPVPVSAPVIGLTPGTVYHFRVTATNGNGTVNGADGTFTTLGGPGYPDYALYYARTGLTAIWYLNNNVYTGGAFGPTLPSGWQLVSTADFNGDGNPDYVLYYARTGLTAIWYLDNNVYTGGAFGPTLPSGWQLVSTADFNGDGNPDYVLYYARTGLTAIWYLNNNVKIGGAFGPTLPSGWQLVSTADF